MPNAADAPLNSPEYWNARFLTDWAARGGQGQTAYFARLAVELLPQWFVTAVREAQMSVFDYGCAFGDALPVLHGVFPEVKLSGGDVAPVAIAVAACVHPTFGFELLPADGQGDVLGDVIYCSNTLEHFEDWKARLEGIARRAREFCVVLVPFREREPRELEHAAAFDYDTLPLRLNNDFQLLHIATADSSRRESQFWPGQQLLAIYGRPREQGGVTAESARRAALDTDSAEWSADFRGVPDALSALVLELRREGVDRIGANQHLLAQAVARSADIERQLEQAGVHSTDLKRALDRAAEAHASAMALVLAEKSQIAGSLEESKAALMDVERRAREAADDVSRLSAVSDKRAKEAGELSLALRRASDEADVLRAEVTAKSSQLSQVQERIRNFAADAASPLDGARAALLELEHRIKFEIEERNRIIALLQNARSIKLARAARSLFGQKKEADRFGEFAPPRPVALGIPDLREIEARIKAVAHDTDVGLPTTARKSDPEPQSAGRPSAKPDRAAPIALPAIEFPQSPVIFQLDQFDKGGLEQVVLDMAWGFRTRGFPVTVVSVGKIGELGGELQSRGIPVLSCEGDETKHRAIADTLQAKAVFLNHSYLGVSNWKALGSPLYDVVHNYYFWQDATRMRVVAEDCHKVIAVSDAVASFHSAQFEIPREKIVVVSNPLHPQGFNRPSREQLQRIRSRWREEFIFINVAHFYPAKAQVALLTAFSEINRKHPRTRLKLLGAFTDGNVEARVREVIAKSRVGSAVSLLGHRSRREIGLDLATSHAFVLPSIYEGCSIAVAEAAYYGLPLVLTDVGSASSLIEREDCGILIPAPVDLRTTTSADISRFGLAEMQSNHHALVDAMMRMVDEYESWRPRGYVAQDKISRRTLESRVKEYAAVAGLPGG